MFRFFLFVFAFFSVANFAQAAPCCSGASSGAKLILGQELQTFSAAFEQARVVDSANELGNYDPTALNAMDFRSRLKLSAARSLADDLQVGASLQLVRKSIDPEFLGLSAGSENSYTGLGETAVYGAYRFLSLYEYHPWKPEIFVFTQLKFPTTKSIHEVTTETKVDATGSGHWSGEIGVVAARNLGIWDGSLSTSLGQDLPRSFEAHTALGKTTFTEHTGLQWSASFGNGIRPFASTLKRKLRVGLFVSHFYQASTTLVYSDETRKTLNRRFWTVGGHLSYAFSEDWVAALTYQNQDFIRQASLALLEESIGLEIQYRLFK